jgi:hypothetical protein
MKLLIAVTGILICVGAASASSLATSSLAPGPLAATPLAAAPRDAVISTDLSSRKLTGGQLRSLKPAKRLVARPMRRIAR